MFGNSENIKLYLCSLRRNKNNRHKSMEKTQRRDTIRAARVKRTAEIVGVSERYVNMVLEGERENEEVMIAFMELKEGENLLVESVKKLVPFN